MEPAVQRFEFLDVACEGCRKPLVSYRFGRRIYEGCPIDEPCPQPTVNLDTIACAICDTPCTLIEYPQEPCDCPSHDEDFIEMDSYLRLECRTEECAAFGDSDPSMIGPE